LSAELRLFSGRTIDVPALFIGGKSDWATYVSPGALDRMRTTTTRMGDIQLIESAGHWIQQEQPVHLAERLLAFAQEAGGTDNING
jgi:pimeloyl-ACP methyl ester carboxylesterase